MSLQHYQRRKKICRIRRADITKSYQANQSIIGYKLCCNPLGIPKQALCQDEKQQQKIGHTQEKYNRCWITNDITDQGDLVVLPEFRVRHGIILPDKTLYSLKMQMGSYKKSMLIYRVDPESLDIYHT
jgi:hypothetical protein